MPHHWRGRGVTAPDPAPDTSLGPARRIPNPPIRCRNGLTHAQASLCPPQGVGVGAGGHARTAHDQECEEERGEVGEGQRQEVDGQARDPTGVQSQLGQSQEEERGHPGTADPDQAAELSPEGTRMASRFHTDPCVPGVAHRCRGTSLLSRGFGFPVLYILIRCIFANDLHDAPHHHHHTCTCRRRSRRHHRVVGCQGGNETPEFASMDLPGSQDDDDDDEVPDSPEPEDEPADKSPELETARASARRPAKPSTAKKGKKTPKSAKSVKKTAQKAPVEEEEELPEPSPPPKKGGKKKVTKPKYKAETKAQPKKKTKSAPEEPATPKEEFVPLDESMVEMPSDMAASRRSSRNRVTPCAFWKNERVVYEEGAYCVLRPRALKLFTEAVFLAGLCTIAHHVTAILWLCVVLRITLGRWFAADTLGVAGRPSHTFVAKGKIKPKTPAPPANRKRRKTSKAKLPAKKKKKLARVSRWPQHQNGGGARESTWVFLACVATTLKCVVRQHHVSLPPLAASCFHSTPGKSQIIITTEPEEPLGPLTEPTSVGGSWWK